MKRVSFSRIAIGVGAASCLLIGAGCRPSPQQQSADIQKKLRQPTEAAAPTGQPVIPPEAQKVPKPY